MANDNTLITIAQLIDFAKKADKRLDALEVNVQKGIAITLESNAWINDSSDSEFPYHYLLTVQGVTTASRAGAVLDTGSIAIATECGVCAVSETATNTVIFKSRTAPTADLTGVLYITKQTAFSGS